MAVPGLAPSLAKVASPTDRPYFLSASQLKSFALCPRKWWFRYVAGVKEPQRTALTLGTRLHSVAERFLLGQPLFPDGWDKGLTPAEAVWIKLVSDAAVAQGIWVQTPGQEVEASVCALVGADHCDERGLPIVASSEGATKPDDGIPRFEIPTKRLDGSPIGITGSEWGKQTILIGFVDVWDLRSAVPHIRDHKTSKSKRYATTPDKLVNDEQMLSYAAVALARRPDATAVDLTHNIYLKSEDAQVYPVHAKAPLARVQEHWASVIATSSEMTALRERKAPPREQVIAKLPQRADQWAHVRRCEDEKPCNAFGGCPYRDICRTMAKAEQVVARLDRQVREQGAKTTEKPSAPNLRKISHRALPVSLTQVPGKTSCASTSGWHSSGHLSSAQPVAAQRSPITQKKVIMFPQPKFKAAVPAATVFTKGDAVHVIDRDENKQYLAEVRVVAADTCDVVLWSPEASAYASDVFEIKKADLSKAPWPNIPIENNLTRVVETPAGPVTSNQTVQEALLLPRGFESGVPADVPAGAVMVVRFPGFDGYVRLGQIKKFADSVVRGNLLTDAGERSGVWVPVTGDGAMRRMDLSPGYCDRRVDDAARSVPASAGGVILEGKAPPSLAAIDPPAVPTAGDPQINTPVADLEATRLAQAAEAAAALLSGAKDSATHPVAAGAAETVKKTRGRPRKDQIAAAAVAPIGGTVSAPAGMTLVLSAEPASVSGATVQSATSPSAPSSNILVKAHLANIKAGLANQIMVLTALQKHLDEAERLLN